jgi:hypothetical protein
MASLRRGLLVGLLLFAPRVALSQDAKAAAVSAYDEAESLIAQGKIAEACPRYAESQRLDPQLGTLLHLADCMEQSGQTASAWASFREASEVAEKRGDPRKELADQRAAALQPRLSKLQIKVSAVPGLQVVRDDVPVGAALWGSAVPTDPGSHLVKVSAPGKRPWQGTAVVKADGTTTTLTVPELVAEVSGAPTATAPPPSTHLDASHPDASQKQDEPASSPAQESTIGQRWPALAAAGVGVVGVAIGSVFGLKSMSRKSSADAHCNGHDCFDTDGVALRKQAIDAGNISTVAFIVGGVGLAAGAVLWFTLPTNKSTQTGKPNERLRIGLGQGVTLERTW